MPLDLSDDELAFLKRHGFAESDVFDARRVAKKLAREQAKQQGKRFLLYWGCTAAERHRLQTRSGHCAQCDPVRIAFHGRHRTKGCVYVAQSAQLDLIKVGGSESLGQREQSLKGYGGATDWRLLKWVEVDEYGAVERAVQERLWNFAYWNARYEKDGKSQQATELFRCSPDVALAALNDALVGRKS